jgi:hypothetical protein
MGHTTLRLVRHVIVTGAILSGCGRSAVGAPPKAPSSSSPTPGPDATATATPGKGMHWIGRIPAGRTLDIHEVSGHVRVVAATGDTAEIEAHTRGAGVSGGAAASDDPPLRIVEDEHGVRVGPQHREHRDGSCTCDHDHGDHDDLPAVDIVAHVPAGVRLVVRTVEGSVEVEGVKGNVDVHAVDGTIDLRSVSSGHARSVNGAIHASFIGAELSDDSELDTVNGSVDVVLPAAASADVAARSLNGTVSVDFPVKGDIESHAASGSIGRGGRKLRLRSVNGPIHVSRAAT